MPAADLAESAVLGFWADVVGVFVYVVLTGYFIYGISRGISGRAALLAGAMTTAFLLARALTAGQLLIDALEVAMTCAWVLLMLRVLGATTADVRWQREQPRAQGVLALGACVLAGLAILALVGVAVWPAEPRAVATLEVVKLLLAALGLVLIEQIVRNTRRGYQWNIKFVSLGLGVIFAYSLVLHADGILYRGTREQTVDLHGFALACAAPFLAIGSSRNRSNVLNVNLSRRFIFRSGMLMLVGGYLLAISLAGYYVRLRGGALADAFVVILGVAASIAFVVAAGSSALRARIRVIVSKNLFEYKFDYRDEWLKLTRALGADDVDGSLQERVIAALGEITHSDGGVLYRRSEYGHFLLDARFRCDWTVSVPPHLSEPLAAYFLAEDWVVDVAVEHVRQAAPSIRELAAIFARTPAARYVIPLKSLERVTGFVVLARPNVADPLIWEDYDLLRVAAAQAAGALAQQAAFAALARAQEFGAMNQMSAFIVHDLKTIVGQLSLLAGNAQRHASNPAFVADMVRTIEHAVQRMHQLLRQLADARESAPRGLVAIIGVARDVVSELARRRPVPELAVDADADSVFGSGEQIAAALRHLVQNAQDATGEDGQVTVEVRRRGDWSVVTVSDNGPGMDAAFVADRLFRPFDSTKGVSGMGIGAHQAREIVRAHGGDVRVDSTPGKGSRFTIELPLTRAADGVAA